MRDPTRRDGVILDLDDFSAERSDRALCRGDLLLGAYALHREELSADLHKRQRQLAEHIELCDGARHRKVIAFPMSGGKFLRPRVNAFHALQPQRTADLLEPRDALAEAVEQRQIEVVLENTQRHPRETRARADVHHRFPREVNEPCQRRAVEQMQLRDGLRFRDGGEVHHLVLF